LALGSDDLLINARKKAQLAPSRSAHHRTSHHHDTATTMPRLATSLLRKAYAIHRFLPPLLGTCRELQSAQNELRWLREHVEKVAKACQAGRVGPAEGKLLNYRSMGIGVRNAIWRTAVRQRARKSDYMAKIMAARKTKGRTPETRQLNPKRHRRAHIDKATKEQHPRRGNLKKAELLRSLVKRRAKGWPLQYGLGTEYFGDLEIECRPGVLIPRSANSQLIR
jgi:hypothetical protein